MAPFLLGHGLAGPGDPYVAVPDAAKSWVARPPLAHVLARPAMTPAKVGSPC
jgi:phosphate starvation-inducible protein PhoH